MKSLLLKIVEKLIEQGKAQGDTDIPAFRGLLELREGLVTDVTVGELSDNAQTALQAIIAMINDMR